MCGTFRSGFAILGWQDRERSARLAIRTLLDPALPLRPDEQDCLMDAALKRLTEYDRSRYKYFVRYRSEAVVRGPRAPVVREHVAGRDWRVRCLPAAKLDQIDAYRDLAVPCIVAFADDQNLPPESAQCWGWARCVKGAVSVFDMLTGEPLDLHASAAEQARLRVQLPEPATGPRPQRLGRSPFQDVGS